MLVVLGEPDTPMGRGGLGGRGMAAEEVHGGMAADVVHGVACTRAGRLDQGGS